MAIELRPYQEEWIAGLRAAFTSGYRSPLGVLPTGGGKTVCFSYLTGRLAVARKRTVLLAHRDELLGQISETLARFDVPHGTVSAGAAYDRRLLAHVASVQTVIRRLDRVAVPDYVIVDEAHHVIEKSSWGKCLAYWRQQNPRLRVIGVTATPERLSGEGLGEMFDEMVLGPSTFELIELGALSPYRLIGPSHHIDASSIGKQNGDFAQAASSAEVQKPQIVGDMIASYREHLKGAPALIFSVSRKDAETDAETMRNAGFNFVALDGKTEKNLRRSIINDLKAGNLNGIASCDLISEGFDVPGIVGVIQRRPTWSRSLDRQQKGRGFRVLPGKEAAIFIDQVGNYARHGLPDDDIEWSLLGNRSKKSKASEASARQCMKCFAVSPSSAEKCRECGDVFPIKARVVEEVAGELSEIEIAQIRLAAVREQAAADTLEELLALAARTGKKPGWAHHVWKARQEKRARQAERYGAAR